ncbi:MAG: IdeS/Mac family cysteine endopeptidase, partial [Akkermansia sp.]|nr:IdeS/Mac family cysteine endopeptidase [Akkermansia sp.]
DTVRQGIGINLNGHGITLWGVEFTDPQTISALWVTDSDDTIASVGDMDLFKVGVDYINGSMYLTDYYSSANRVDSLTVLDASEIDEWGLPRVYIDLPAPLSAVPEPTTATLSILALAALSARRRRN